MNGDLSLRHTLTAYFNSFLREWPEHVILADWIEVAMPEGKQLRVGLSRFSSLGRHQYDGRFELFPGTSWMSLTTSEAMKLVAAAMAGARGVDPDAVERFLARVEESRAAIATGLERRADDESLFALDFGASEQALLLGHNFHPTPKSQKGFSQEDADLYSPERRGRFPLAWLGVREEILHVESAESFRDDWLETLFLNDARSFLPAGYRPLPMHPWQLAKLEARPEIEDFFATGALLKLGLSNGDWLPTSSVRAVYRESAPYMLKFSLSVKITNSIRHLLPHEVVRGLQLTDVFATEEGRTFLRAQERFEVLREPAFACLKAPSGELIAESLVVCRENPFRGETSENCALLASLLQDAPHGGLSPLARLLRESAPSIKLEEKARAWLDGFFASVLEPLLLAHAEYGIILCAHQQNIILKLDGGYPVASYYRDCQGTGYSRLGLVTFQEKVPHLDPAGPNVVSDPMAHALFGYYLFVNATFNVVAGLSDASGVDEAELLSQLCERLAHLRGRGLKDPSFFDYLLESPVLQHKGNFACTLSDLNENTSADPLSIYRPIDNPFVTRKSP